MAKSSRPSSKGPQPRKDAEERAGKSTPDKNPDAGKARSASGPRASGQPSHTTSAGTAGRPPAGKSPPEKKLQAKGDSARPVGGKTAQRGGSAATARKSGKGEVSDAERTEGVGGMPDDESTRRMGSSADGDLMPEDQQDEPDKDESGSIPPQGGGKSGNARSESAETSTPVQPGAPVHPADLRNPPTAAGMQASPSPRLQPVGEETDDDEDDADADEELDEDDEDEEEDKDGKMSGDRASKKRK
jgi:hypothetical protein